MSVTTLHRIDPTTVYSVEAARTALGLRKTTLRREIREGRLKCSRRAGRTFIKGAWLLEWIEAGVMLRPDRSPVVPVDRAAE